MRFRDFISACAIIALSGAVFYINQSIDCLREGVLRQSMEIAHLKGIEPASNVAQQPQERKLPQDAIDLLQLSVDTVMDGYGYHRMTIDGFDVFIICRW